MKILAIDTATEACSAAVLVDGHEESVFEIAPRDHTQLILGMIDQLLRNNGLSVSDFDALAYGRGPGSFTGVRIAAGVVQGLAFTENKPVIAISNLAALAQGAYESYSHEKLLCAIDARMQEIYWGEYHVVGGLAVLQGAEVVTAPEALQVVSGDELAGVGTGWGIYADEIQQATQTSVEHIYPEYLPSAKFIARLAASEYQQGNLSTAAEALPVYLRDNVAKKAKSLL